MWPPTEISYRKFKRKAHEDGYRKATLSALELFSRRVALWPFVNQLCDRGTFSLLGQSEFHDRANAIVSVDNKTEAYNAFAAPFVADIGSGYILTETGLVTTDDGHIINANLFPPQCGRRFVVAKLIWQLFFEEMALTTGLVRNDTGSLDTYAVSSDCVAPLIPRYSDNYYHWTIETVPKIRYLKEFEQKTDCNITYLMPRKPPSWLKQTLDLLEVPESKVEYASDSIYKCNRLVLPSFPIQSRSNYEWIVDRILTNANLDLKTIGGSNNIYISRSNAVERRVINEDEVMEALSEYGFERYLLEDYTVEENVTLFNNADVIVGAHGAGLTDLIYCEDATIIELFGSKVKAPYRRLADTMNVSYEALQCTPKSTDLRVDPKQLTSAVESVL
jgi:hypothetical protein